MSERGTFRSRPHSRGGGSGGHHHHTNQRGGGHNQHRGGAHGSTSSGGGGGGSGTGGATSGTDRPKKENILDLAKYMDKRICVRFNGGREVTGILKGYDQLTNLVLDSARETLRSDDDDDDDDSSSAANGEDTKPNRSKTTERELGLVVARGTLLVMISPVDGTEEIANPFTGGGGGGEENAGTAVLAGGGDDDDDDDEDE